MYWLYKGTLKQDKLPFPDASWAKSVTDEPWRIPHWNPDNCQAKVTFKLILLHFDENRAKLVHFKEQKKNILLFNAL